MKRFANPSRRRVILTSVAGAGGLLLPGCDRLSQAPTFRRFLDSGETLSFTAQRLLLAGQPLAREFSARDRSPTFRTNGSTLPVDTTYQALAGQAFKDWRLRVDGLVTQPCQLSMDQLRAMPARSQITRHDCVEGWSAIGQWTGVPLAEVLKLAGLAPHARYIVFHCADDMDGSTAGRSLYYESIDLFDAFHPQTILAYAMNGLPLEIGHGAPLRLRVERQLGYKQAKFVMRIEAVDSLARLGGGRGGYWEDQGYEWYAGV